MKILLINPPHLSIGSRIPDEHLPRLGLLSIGGPLIDHGHQGTLMDAEFGPMTLQNMVAQTKEYDEINGIAYLKNGIPTKTKPAPIIENIDIYRVGWELMGSNNYTYWGKKKAVVVQFSRGCRHKCTYCGQTIFWKKWRHRNPELFAREITMLHKKYGIEVFNFADENPATDKEAWKRFLIALIVENITVILVGSIRADNIVRDVDILHLYKKAGFERFLLGIEKVIFSSG